MRTGAKEREAWLCFSAHPQLHSASGRSLESRVLRLEYGVFGVDIKPEVEWFDALGPPLLLSVSCKVDSNVCMIR
jgi:hypothetical protein